MDFSIGNEISPRPEQKVGFEFMYEMNLLDVINCGHTFPPALINFGFMGVISHFLIGFLFFSLFLSTIIPPCLWDLYQLLLMPLDCGLSSHCLAHGVVWTICTGQSVSSLAACMDVFFFFFPLPIYLVAYLLVVGYIFVIFLSYVQFSTTLGFARSLLFNALWQFVLGHIFYIYMS